jgi:hypothetical protein
MPKGESLCHQAYLLQLECIISHVIMAEQTNRATNHTPESRSPGLSRLEEDITSYRLAHGNRALRCRCHWLDKVEPFFLSCPALWISNRSISRSAMSQRVFLCYAFLTYLYIVLYVMVFAANHLCRHRGSGGDPCTTRPANVERNLSGSQVNK